MPETTYLHAVPIHQKLHNGLHPAVHHFVAPQVSPGVPAPVGDGLSHPLSAHYSSLAEAQTDYPHATDLTQELAWAAIQAGLNSLRGIGGGHLFVPRGTYRLSDELQYGSGIQLYGEGSASVLRNSPTRTGGIYRMLAPVDGPPVIGVTIENITFDQNASAFGDNVDSPAVSVNSTQRTTVRNCYFRNLLTMAIWCDAPYIDDTGAVVTTQHLHIADNIIESSWGGGISLFGALNDVHIIGNNISNTKDDAIAIQARNKSGSWYIPNSFNISGNNIFLCDHRNSLGSTPNGINVYGAGNGVVSGNSIFLVASNGITVISPDPAATAHNVTVSGNSIGGAGQSISHDGMPPDDLTGVPRNGIHLYFTKHVSVTGNTIEKSGGDGIRLRGAVDCSITGNLVKTSLLAGIDLEGVSECTVTGNTVLDNGVPGITPFGILINASAGYPCRDIVVVGNRSGNSYLGETSFSQDYGAFFVTGVDDHNTNIFVQNNDFTRNNIDQNNAVQPVDVIFIAGKAYGSTTDRPISPSTGQMYFDTDLNIPVWKASEPNGYVGALGPNISFAGCIPFAEGLDTPGNVLQTSNLRWLKDLNELVIGGQIQLTGSGTTINTPLKLNGSKEMFCGKIDLNNKDDVMATGFGNGQVPVWITLNQHFEGRDVPLIDPGMLAGDICKILSTGPPLILGRATDNDICQALFGHNFPVTAADVGAATLGARTVAEVTPAAGTFHSHIQG